MKEAAAALGVGGPLLQANPLLQARHPPKKTKLKELKAPARLGQMDDGRNKGDNSKNKSFNKREVVAGNAGVVNTRTLQEKIFAHNGSTSVNFFPAKKGEQKISDNPTPAAHFKSQTQQAVVSVMKTPSLAVKEEPGLVEGKSASGRRMRGIPVISRSANSARNRVRGIVAKSKPGKLPQANLVVKQEMPEVGGKVLKSSRKRAMNAKKHKNIGNLKHPNNVQKRKTASKLENAENVKKAKKPAVKVETSLDEEEEVAIEYEEREESACPYCMKQFTCWQKVTTHMGKVHANEY